MLTTPDDVLTICLQKWKNDLQTNSCVVKMTVMMTVMTQWVKNGFDHLLLAIKYSSARQPQLIEIPFCLYNNIETVDFSYDGNKADENNWLFSVNEGPWYCISESQYRQFYTYHAVANKPRSGRFSCYSNYHDIFYSLLHFVIRKLKYLFICFRNFNLTKSVHITRSQTK